MIEVCNKCSNEFKNTDIDGMKDHMLIVHHQGVSAKELPKFFRPKEW